MGHTRRKFHELWAGQSQFGGQAVKSVNLPATPTEQGS
jgi:hypothetical protein